MGRGSTPTLRHDLWYMYIAWSSTLRDDLLQTMQRIWYKICPAPDHDIRRSNTNLHCIFKSPIQSYQIKTHTDVPYPCYHGNALSINNYTSTAQSYIHIFIYINTFPVILVVSVKFMPITCNNRTINWFFKIFKIYEFHT